jgi:purine-binding chemotaxis protein CheW
MSGVINLRGSVVPVVDLRLCFKMSKTERTRNTCIVVVEVILEGDATVIGALADSVEEVIDLEPDQIQPAPKIGTQIHTDFIRGMGKRENQFIMIPRYRSCLLRGRVGCRSRCGDGRAGFSGCLMLVASSRRGS